ncbi:hypothetical protein SNARM312S_03196 [Streptomyces narbonensis]
MKIDLTDTNSSKINKAILEGRRAVGTPAVGVVLTLLVVTDEENAYDADGRRRGRPERPHLGPTRGLSPPE